MVNLEVLIKEGRVSLVELPVKRKELFQNQISMLKDDIDNMKTLYDNGRYRGAFIHAFDALERAIDAFLVLNGLRVKDRFSREIAIKEKLGGEILGEFEELYDLRRSGMYEGGLVSKELVLNLVEKALPRIIEKVNDLLPERERIVIDLGV